MLKGTGLKATTARVDILAVLARVKQPVTVKDLVQLLPEGDQATTYRNVSLLAKHNLVRQVDLGQGHAYYELNDEKDDHHHIICVACDRIEDFSECTVDQLTRSALRQQPSFKTVIRHSIELFGICSSCQK